MASMACRPGSFSTQSDADESPAVDIPAVAGALLTAEGEGPHLGAGLAAPDTKSPAKCFTRQCTLCVSLSSPPPACSSPARPGSQLGGSTACCLFSRYSPCKQLRLQNPVSDYKITSEAERRACGSATISSQPRATGSIGRVSTADERKVSPAFECRHSHEFQAADEQGTESSVIHWMTVPPGRTRLHGSSSGAGLPPATLTTA